MYEGITSGMTPWDTKTVADIFSEQTLGIMKDDTRAELQIIKDATNRKVAETVGLLESDHPGNVRDRPQPYLCPRPPR